MEQTSKGTGMTGVDTSAAGSNGVGLAPSDSARGTAGAQAAGLGTSAHNVIHKVAESAHPAVDKLASTAHHTLDRLASAADSTVDTIGRRGSQLVETQSRLTEACRGYVRDNPLAAVGIAAAAGFLLCYLTTAKRANRDG